jgi:hypothetical protein
MLLRSTILEEVDALMTLAEICMYLTRMAREWVHSPFYIYLSIHPRQSHILSCTAIVMSATFELNCWVLGDKASHVFPVKISATETIGALKDMIKDKNKNTFQDISASALVLWRVSS